MFYVMTVILVCCTVWAYLTRGPRMAIAVAWGYALLIPTSTVCKIGPTVCNERTVGAVVALGILLATSCRLFPGGLLLADVLVAALTFSQLSTEYAVGDLTGSTILSAIVDWVIPYLLGRIVFESVRDLPRLTYVAAFVCLGLSLLAIVESVGRINVLNSLLGHVGSIQGETDIRWGLKRAEGPASHPIFFGMMLVLMLPWALAAAKRAKGGEGPRWWLALPWITGIAAFCTMSRGPQIGVMTCVFLTIFFRFPAWRGRFAAAAVAVGLVVAVAYKPLIGVLHVWSNEAKQEMQTVVIGGQTMEYSGTTHRLLQVLVYQEAALKAGWGGYGLMCMSASPSKVPYVEDHLRTGVFYSIDNHYLWMLLKAGYGGISLFILIGICGLSYLVRPALALDAPHSALAGGLFAAILAVMVLVSTVFFAADFGFLWMFSVGLAGSLRQDFNSLSVIPIAPLVRPRLAPGHPVTFLTEQEEGRIHRTTNQGELSVSGI